MGVLPSLALLMVSAMPRFTFANVLAEQSAAIEQNANAKPWTFWHWKLGAVSKSSIHADLVGMKNVGLGGCYLVPVRSALLQPEYKDEAIQLSPKLLEMVDYSFQQADSLGLEMGVFVSDNFALAANPPILPAESMQKVVWTDTIMKGGKKLESMMLRQPEAYKDYYEDIAAFAVRQKEVPQVFKPVKVENADSVSTSDIFAKEDVVRLKMDGDRIVGAIINEIVVNKLPKGTWRLLRMGHTSTGQANEAAGDSKGLEIDKFSPAVVKKLFTSWYELFLNRPHADVVKYLHLDSWECGSQNWGYQFVEEFKARRGYDLIPYLPMMAGVPMVSVEKYKQVLKDIRLTVNELVNEKFLKTFTDLAQEYDLKVTHTSNAPTYPADGFVETCNIWNKTPAKLKPMLDRKLAHGINLLVFQGGNTWNPEARGFVDYITRCQNLLLQGNPVVDIAVFTGEENPGRSLTPGKLVPMLPGYKYDLMNKEVLLKWDLSYDLKGTMPNHHDYRILMIPQQNLSAEVKAKIKELREEGIIVIDSPYQASDFSQYGIAPDVVLPEHMDYAHRKIRDPREQKDIYFLTNQENKERSITATFRTNTVDSRQIVIVTLPAYGSCFVILSDKAGTKVITQDGLTLENAEGLDFH